MEQIDTIISQLSLEQKADLCSGLDAWNTFPIKDCGVPGVLMTDGPHGLRKQYDESTAMLEQSVPATCYPAASTTACSWDRELLYEMGAALGSEAREQGIPWCSARGSIKRSPLCGRNFEYFSEDPALAGGAWRSYDPGNPEHRNRRMPETLRGEQPRIFPHGLQLHHRQKGPCARFTLTDSSAP